MNLSPDEQLLLEFVYEEFDRNLGWPLIKLAKRQLYQRGYRKLIIDEILARLAPKMVRRIMVSSGEALRLTLDGFQAINRSIELNDFVCILRMAVDRYGEHTEDKTINTADLVRRCGLDTKRLRKLDVLLETEIYIARSTKRGPDGGPFEWEVDDEITRYQDVYDIDPTYTPATEPNAMLGTIPATNIAAVASAEPVSW